MVPEEDETAPDDEKTFLGRHSPEWREGYFAAFGLYLTAFGVLNPLYWYLRPAIDWQTFWLTPGIALLLVGAASYAFRSPLSSFATAFFQRRAPVTVGFDPNPSRAETELFWQGVFYGGFAAFPFAGYCFLLAFRISP